MTHELWLKLSIRCVNFVSWPQIFQVFVLAIIIFVWVRLFFVCLKNDWRWTISFKKCFFLTKIHFKLLINLEKNDIHFYWHPFVFSYIIFPYNKGENIHVQYQIREKKRRRKRPFTKNRVGRVYITLRQTAGKFSSHMATIYFNILLIPNIMYNIHIYFSTPRSIPTAIYRSVYVFIHRPYNTHIESTCFINVYKHNLFELYICTYIHTCFLHTYEKTIQFSCRSNPPRFDSYQIFLMPAYCRDSSFSIENIRK